MSHLIQMLAISEPDPAALADPRIEPVRQIRIATRNELKSPDHATEAALAALAQSSVAELRNLRVDRSDEKLCLSGRVRTFYHKQLAQEAVRLVAAGREVVNRVHVG